MTDENERTDGGAGPAEGMSKEPQEPDNRNVVPLWRRRKAPPQEAERQLDEPDDDGPGPAAA